MLFIRILSEATELVRRQCWLTQRPTNSILQNLAYMLCAYVVAIAKVGDGPGQAQYPIVCASRKAKMIDGLSKNCPRLFVDGAMTVNLARAEHAIKNYRLAF